MTILTVAPKPHAAGTYTFDAPNPVQPGTMQAKFTLTLSDADKSAVGKTLTWTFLFSADGGQTYSEAVHGGWTSYGPAGVVSPIGQMNPDPVLIVQLSARAGQLLRAVMVLSDPMTAGVIIDVT